ncbi:MAG: hypothetical protein IT379_24775 [Deltaproteobacteria bacterium]|nr:hypothetical protein [Deltaproteobacteria bacterium]
MASRIVAVVLLASAVLAGCGSNPPPRRERVPDTLSAQLPPGAVRVAPGRPAQTAVGPASLAVAADALPPGAVVAIEGVAGNEPNIELDWRRVTPLYRVWPGMIPRGAGTAMHTLQLPLASPAAELGRAVDLRRAAVFARSREGEFVRVESRDVSFEAGWIRLAFPSLELDEGASEQVIFVGAPEGASDLTQCQGAEAVLRERLAALQQCSGSDRCEERTFPIGGEPCLLPAAVGRDGQDVLGAIENMRRSGCPLPAMGSLTGDAQQLHVCERAPQATNVACVNVRCVYVIPQ